MVLGYENKILLGKGSMKMGFVFRLPASFAHSFLSAASYFGGLVSISLLCLFVSLVLFFCRLSKLAGIFVNCASLAFS